jgi:squalene synthase HpnC
MGISTEGRGLPAERDENFPVALRVLPSPRRKGLHAVYAFARTVDDLGDRAPGDRTALLAAFGDDLDRIWTGDDPESPVLRLLSPVVARHHLPREPFRHLLEANLIDQRVSSYATFDDLLGYCRLSADPVGRIVLGLLDHHEADTVVLSDRVCTALQLLEHWQDVGEDRRAGRVYLPLDDLAAFGVPVEDLDLRSTSERLRGLMRFETERAACLLESGAPVVRALHGWGRVAVAGYVAGGRATVTALRRSGGDVLSRAPRPRRPDLVLGVTGLLTGAALHHRVPRLHPAVLRPGRHDVHRHASAGDAVA